MRREFTINFAQFSVINQTGGESPRPSIKIWICHFVILRKTKNLKQNKYKMCETRFFGYRLRMTIGRAWIFSENGHPFVRIRGHFPCQRNNPPLQLQITLLPLLRVRRRLPRRNRVPKRARRGRPHRFCSKEIRFCASGAPRQA